MEYYSARKRKLSMIHATICKNLEKHIKEASHKMPHIVLFHLCMSRTDKSIERVNQCIPGAKGSDC
jgi:predicted ABC-type ATPase